MMKNWALVFCAALLMVSAASANQVINIDQTGVWESCTVCAGLDGAGPVASYSMWTNQNSPSLDGNSARFNLAGSIPYGDALWWRQLTPDPSAHNFQYDFWVYLANPNAPEALEFDVNQSVNGKKFIFGTECDFTVTHRWRIWDSNNAQWVTTSVGCAPVQAYTWNHLVIELKRTPDDKVFFVDVVINGQHYYWNQVFLPKYNVNASELNVAVQLDGNSQQTPYSIWMDKVTLNFW